MEEKWKNYNEYVTVSNFGNVMVDGEIYEPKPDANGYMRIRCHGICLHLHRIVAELFIPNPENKPIVGHTKTMENGLEDKTANEVWNLAWMTYKENNNYGTKNERISNALKGKKLSEKTIKKLINNPNKSKQVYQYTLDNKLVKIWPSVGECERNGFHHVCDVCNGKRKYDKGYLWSYELKNESNS